jgi:FlaA1/EpsC-like NDP-sugar epimerase
MKEKVFIFGSSSTGQNILHAIEEIYEVIGFLDNDTKRWTINGGGGGGGF